MSVTLSADSIVPHASSYVSIPSLNPVVPVTVTVANGGNTGSATMYLCSVSDMVYLNMAPHTGWGSSTANAVFTINSIPAAYRPSFTQRTPLSVVENELGAVGRCDITTNGIITVSANATGAAFTATTSGFYLNTGYIAV